ncbi:hypothetical protein FDF69_20280 [Clostridium sporogenes]|uniref:hypothetical protein n=1 Tax=Clostridium sporogenes TaxID=1509 RepID=UPI0013D33AA4|nr:hypothetical protein [Clostridium sporogenes]NFF69440.1 hypothetical protein [Clostridium sporogenes]NFG00712.1 hypothetical protein [Clostridium sporogenes]NFG08280.1 hypothetical protein [Clostridium sporogenes]NFG53413.1 hypothetical protein [Clostridium sporogenes]NFP86239.1 hypothetical protein [Clostridium sporogenes]
MYKIEPIIVVPYYVSNFYFQGDRIIYTATRSGYTDAIYSRKLDGESEVLLEAHTSHHVTNKPDSEKVFYLNSEDYNYIYTQNYDSNYYSFPPVKYKSVNHRVIKWIDNYLFGQEYAGNIIVQLSPYYYRLKVQVGTGVDFYFVYNNRVYYSTSGFALYSVEINTTEGNNRSENTPNGVNFFRINNIAYYRNNVEDKFYKYNLDTRERFPIEHDNIKVLNFYIEDEKVVFKGTYKGKQGVFVTGLNFKSVVETELPYDLGYLKIYQDFIYYSHSNQILKIPVPPVGLNLFPKVNGETKSTVATVVKVNGELKKVINGWVKVNGELKKF